MRAKSPRRSDIKSDTRQQRIVRRGAGKSPGSHVRWRRGVVVHASSGGNSVPVIARLVATSPDRVRQMIHRFNESPMEFADPQWAGGRGRRITTDDEAFIVETARTRPRKLAQPFTRWSIRKLAAYLADNPARVVDVSRERLRVLGAALASSAAARELHKLHGVRQFHGCYSVGDDELWGVVRRRKSAANTLAALRGIRARRPDGEPVYVILDNLSAHKGSDIRKWAKLNRVELCFTPTYSSWANPIEAHFGPLREFVPDNSDHPNHTVLTRRLHAYLRWRNANKRSPELLAAQRRERARIRAERQQRWGRPTKAAA